MWLINLNALQVIEKANESFNAVRLTDLVCIGNILKAGEIDSTVVEDFGTYIEINGLHDVSKFIDRYATVGREIVKITSIEQLTTTSKVYITRAQYGTINSYTYRNDGLDYEIQENYSFRTVTIFDVLEWNFDTNSNGTSNPFSFDLESGKCSIPVDDYKDWNRVIKNRKYNIIPKTSTVQLFRGYNGQRTLLYTGFINREFYSNSKDGRGRLSLRFYDKFIKWKTKDMDKVFSMSNASPTNFFQAVVDIEQNMVIYGNGLTESDLPKVTGVYSKEYTTYGDLLSTYCLHGFRFHFDELERIKVFCDIYGSKIQAVTETPIVETNMLDIGLDTEKQMIYNLITSSYEERRTLYDFQNQLNGMAKYFPYKTENVNFTMLTGVDEEFYTLTVTDQTLFKRTLIESNVVLKDKLNGMEFNARVLNKGSNYSSELIIARFDKDYMTLPIGKYDYLMSLGYNLPRQFDLYYGAEGLPTIFSLTIADNSDTEQTQNLKYPLLPQVTGFGYEQYAEWECEFGDADDLEIGEYSGYFDNITSIYGTFNSSKLLYNREYDQLAQDGTKYPYICALSTRTNIEAGHEDDSYLKFTSFDNSNLEVSVYKSDDTNADIVLHAKNTQTISPTLLKTETPIYVSSTLIQVASLDDYNVGDVIVIEKPTGSMTTEEYELYTKCKNMRYRIVATSTEGSNYYIYINYSYPSINTTVGGNTTQFTFSFVRYPSTSIVYLNELYIKGNPIIKLSQDIEIKDDTSVAMYEKQSYKIDGRFYCNDTRTFKDNIQYFLDNYAGINEDGLDYKAIFTVKVRDKYHIQKGDVIKLQDSLYTGIDTSSLWYVLGVSHSHKTPETSLDIIRVNTRDTDGSDIEFTDKLTYSTISTVNYSYTESSSDVGKTVVSASDDDLGSITIQRVNRTSFRADVLSYDSNYILFTNLSGSDMTSYEKTFFSGEAEFVVLIDGEFIYVKYIDDHRVSIIKRGLFDSTQANITTSSNVTFYTITAGTSISGYLSSTSAFIGTDSDHLKFTPLVGMEVKTEGNVAIQNKYNRLYFDKSSVNNASQLLLAVDWKDTDGTVKPKYNGVEFQVGESSASTGYLKFDTTTGLEIAIGSQSSGNYFSYNSTDGLNMSGTITLQDSASGVGFLNFGEKFTVSTYEDLSGYKIFQIYDKTNLGKFELFNSSDAGIYSKYGELSIYNGGNGIRLSYARATTEEHTFSFGSYCRIDTNDNITIRNVPIEFNGIRIRPSTYSTTSPNNIDVYYDVNKKLGIYGNGYTLYSNVTGLSGTLSGGQYIYSDKDPNGSLAYISEKIGTTAVSKDGTNYLNVPIIKESLMFKTRTKGWVEVFSTTYTPDDTNTSTILTSSII